MLDSFLKSRFLKKATFHLCLLSFTFFTTIPENVSAGAVTIEEPGCDVRQNMALALAGITIIALGVGVGYAASQTNSRCHDHSCCSYYSCGSYSPCSSYSWNYDSYYSDCGCDYDHHHHHHHSPGSYFSESYYFREGSYFTDGDNIVAADLGNAAFPTEITTRKKKNIPQLQTHTLSGVFSFRGLPTKINQGNLSLFIQLPDGSTQLLGQADLEHATYVTFPLGSFEQKGTYAFWVTLDQKTTPKMGSQIATLDLTVDGLSVEHFQFDLSSSRGESERYSYTLD